MISRARAAEILRLYHAEHWPVGTIAAQLGLHRDTVRRVLTQAGVPVPRRAGRTSMIAPYLPFILHTLQQYPRLRASRLYAMVRARGYPGAPDHFRHLLGAHRPRPPAEAYLRLRTLPGEQAQVDWAHFGTLGIGRARRPLMGFVMVLSYSRALFLRFYLGADLSAFLHGHVSGFTHFGAVPRVVLYDNLKSAVLERAGDAIRFNPHLLELAAHYRFQPRPVAVGRGNEKGRVERAIRYVREAFFPARRFADLDDLNAQALSWCAGPAAERPCPEDRSISVRTAFERERPHLLGLPDAAFPCEQPRAVRVRKTPYVRFDGNDYSVPHTCVQRIVTVLASPERVRILDALQLIAVHARSYDRGAQIEQPEHIQGLVDHKRAARAHRAQDRLHHAAPSARALFLRAAARGAHLGVLTRGLLALLDRHGAHALQAAIVAALDQDAAHLGAVRQLIDQHARARAQPPPVAVTLPPDPRLRELNVQPHPLSDYERLHPTESADERTHDDRIHTDTDTDIDARTRDDGPIANNTDP